MCSCLLGACVGVSWVQRVGGQLGPGLGVSRERLAGGNARATVERGALNAGGVRVDGEVATLRVEVVQLLRVAALPGLAVGAALVIDRGAVRLRVQVRVTAARRRIEAAAVDRGGRALG